MEELLKFGWAASYKKGEVLIRPTDVGADFFIIVSGFVRVCTIESTGEKNIHIIYGPGEVFPLAWLTHTKPLQIYYEAVSDCEVLRIPAQKTQKILKTNVTVTYAMLQQVIRQFVLYKARVDNLEYKFARERVAYGLLLLATRFGKQGNSGISIPRLSHDEIGSATNVSRESVGRELKRLERLGLIEYDTGTMIIRNLAKLRLEVAPDGSRLFVDDI